MEQISLTVNGAEYSLPVDPAWTLLRVLRGQLGLTGAKCGCDTASCGACTVLLDGEAVRACTVRINKAQGRCIETIEGLAQGTKLHPVQQAFIDCGAVQCGFCTPGMVMSALALLRKNPRPTEAEVRLAIDGNLCRCTGYVKIVEAVLEAARRMAAEKAGEADA